jgi:hypothetical protein
MRAILRRLGLAILGLAIGAGTLATWTMQSARAQRTVHGVWSRNSLPGQQPTGPYHRLQIAMGGLLGLPPDEAIYLVAETDERGRAFDAACRYRIEGVPPPTRWWSLTPYDANSHLIPNPGGRYSIGSTSVMLDVDGRFSVTLAADDPGALPLDAEPGGHVLLRLYDPEPGLVERLGELELPTIEREECS